MSPSVFTKVPRRISYPDFISSYSPLPPCQPHRPSLLWLRLLARAFAPFPRYLLAHALASFTSLLPCLLGPYLQCKPCPSTSVALPPCFLSYFSSPQNQSHVNTLYTISYAFVSALSLLECQLCFLLHPTHWEQRPARGWHSFHVKGDSTCSLS